MSITVYKKTENRIIQKKGGVTFYSGSEQSIDKEALSNISAGQLVYVDVNNGKVDKVIANSSNALRYIGFAKDNISAGFVGKIQLEGIVSLNDWTQVIGSTALTIGSTYYISDTAAGMMTTSPPSTGSWRITAGIALSSTQFNIINKETIKL
jgi:hypothetical protein